MPIKTKKISKKVAARWRFPDGHVEVIIKVPILPDVTLRIESDEVVNIREILEDAEAWIKEMKG